MNKAKMNKGNIIYDLSRVFDEIYDNVKLALELIDEGETETAIDILKAVKKEVGGE